MAIVGSGLTRRGGRLLPVFGGVAGPTNLPNYRAALAAAKAGTTGPLIINMYGDSTIMGTGAGSPLNASITGNPRGAAINQALANIFAANGLAKNGADVFGFNFPLSSGYTAADYLAFNASVSQTGSWVPSNNSIFGVAGYYWNAQNATGGNYIWNAENRQFNKLTVSYLEFSGGGTFRIRIDGAIAQTINSTGATAIERSIDIAVTLSTHSVEVEWVSGSDYWYGLETVDTTNKQSVRIRNLGGGSSTSTALVNNASAWSNKEAYRNLSAASLHIVEGGVINDWITAVPNATTTTNINTMLATDFVRYKGGDVLLVGPTRSNTATYTDASQQASVDAMAASTAVNGTTVVFYDIALGTGGVGKYATMSGLSRMSDNVHPNYNGYAAEAAALYGAIT